MIGAAKEGAEWAWTRLYEDLAPSLLGYVRVRGATNPEDLVGEVFVQLARNLPNFSGDATSFRSWVFTIASPTKGAERHAALRSRSLTHLTFPGTSQRAQRTPPRDIGTESVMALLGNLTLDQRNVLALRVIADLSLEETAGVLDKEVRAVKQLQRRALVSLRKEIDRGAVTL